MGLVEPGLGNRLGILPYISIEIDFLWYASEALSV